MTFELEILKQILEEQKRTNELLEKLIPKEETPQRKVKGK